ncbi:MAG: aminopeptidase P N-terminal domain-containing protein [Candidatus Acidiferrum sp.]
MRNILFGIGALSVVLFATTATAGSDLAELKDRRRRAARQFPDGVLLLHSRTMVDSSADGYREEARFYYFTGLENSPGDILAIDGRSRESWLFVRPVRPGETPEVKPGDAAALQLGLEHIVDWWDLDAFLAQQAKTGAKIYYQRGHVELPPSLAASKDTRAPAWIQVLEKKWPATDFLPVGVQLDSLLAVESPAEQETTRAAARATVTAVMAGMKSIRPGISQRNVELAVEAACWEAGAHGVAFWPWAMAGANSVFPKPFGSTTRYDHLDAPLHEGDLVRLDVGCEWGHYQGDLGRTVPVSGHYTEEQREIWNMFVDAYQAGVKELREGATEALVFEAWRGELLRHTETVKTPLATQAIQLWTERKNVPYWQMHTTNLDAGYIEGALRAGTVIDFEPITSLGGQGYYLEDMFLITRDGAEVLTPGVPYTAEEIEAAMTAKR